jgi:hypothetical protein
MSTGSRIVHVYSWWKVVGIVERIGQTDNGTERQLKMTKTFSATPIAFDRGGNFFKSLDQTRLIETTCNNAMRWTTVIIILLKLLPRKGRDDPGACWAIQKRGRIALSSSCNFSSSRLLAYSRAAIQGDGGVAWPEIDGNGQLEER